MEISFSKRGASYQLIVRADNVSINHDIEERIYPKKEDGSPDFLKGGTKEIKTSALDMITELLSDMIYERDNPYNSTELIKRLFDKLPPSEANTLSKKLYNDFAEIEETE